MLEFITFILFVGICVFCIYLVITGRNYQKKQVGDICIDYAISDSPQSPAVYLTLDTPSDLMDYKDGDTIIFRVRIIR